MFISHRGKDIETGADTKREFVCFLHSQLAFAGIRAFMDERDLTPGNKEAWLKMLAELRSCRIAVPVLHESYGNSEYCLDELVAMVDAERVIMPVFVSKNRTDVLHALTAGADSLGQGTNMAERARRWKAAIDAVGRATGRRLEQGNGYVPLSYASSWKKQAVKLSGLRLS